MIVTSAPSPRVVAATSSPMNPPPITTSRRPARSHLPQRPASSSVRSDRDVLVSGQQRAACEDGSRWRSAAGRSAAQCRRTGRPGAQSGRSPAALTSSSSSIASRRYHSVGRYAERIGRVAAGEQLLGQRRAVVGTVRLRADHPDRPRRSRGAGGSRRSAGRPGRRRRSRYRIMRAMCAELAHGASRFTPAGKETVGSR